MWRHSETPAACPHVAPRLSIFVPLFSLSVSLELDLWGSIVPEESTIRVIPVKVELKLKKAAGGRWEALEGDGTAVPAQAMGTRA